MMLNVDVCNESDVPVSNEFLLQPYSPTTILHIKRFHCSSEPKRPVSSYISFFIRVQSVYLLLHDGRASTATAEQKKRNK